MYGRHRFSIDVPKAIGRLRNKLDGLYVAKEGRGEWIESPAYFTEEGASSNPFYVANANSAQAATIRCKFRSPVLTRR